MFTQMYSKEGKKKFGQKAVSAMLKEYIHTDKGPMELNTFVTPIYPDTLSYEDKNESLVAIRLIKR